MIIFMPKPSSMHPTGISEIFFTSVHIYISHSLLFIVYCFYLILIEIKCNVYEVYKDLYAICCFRGIYGFIFFLTVICFAVFVYFVGRKTSLLQKRVWTYTTGNTVQCCVDVCNANRYYQYNIHSGIT